MHLTHNCSSSAYSAYSHAHASQPNDDRPNRSITRVQPAHTFDTFALCPLCHCVHTDAVHAQLQPRLEILPIQSVQRKPVGKSLMLTCRPDVPDTSLVTDLQWRDNLNMTVAPKP